GSWCSAGVKSTCPANTSSIAGSGELTDCICLAGYTGSDGTACTGCIPGKYKTDPGSAACTSCLANKYSTTVAATASTTCQDCPLNTLSATGSDALIDCTCLAGYIGDDGVECTACEAGTYKIATGTGTCTSCLANKYSTIVAATLNTCQVCPPNTFAPVGSDAQIDCTCLAGHTASFNGMECTPCGAGTYKTATGTGTCTPCNLDTYSSSIAATVVDTCIACPSNTSSTQNSVDLSNCTCIAGYIGDDGTPCTACAKGTYKIATGEGFCTPCAADSYSDIPAATSEDTSPCTPCPAGTYKEQSGNSICIPCPVDTYSTTVAATS
ncbi:hypothetical protein T484DRAFT_1601495, partial [Baffinella frigidus]